ncbi:hypothetical protein [Flagellimonas sp.]|uniref:hypothetical protein n=1 Tax=Flagellimonas sp. TaxID=2058762 RepID=UPI003B58C964
MRTNIITLIALLLNAVVLLGQSFNPSRSDTGALTGIPQESVFLQYNESLVFSGDRLLYKFYCLDKINRALTNISKIGYVSLINKEGEAVFTHKVRLTSGTGYGDFFVPTSIPTGSYKLLGYSEWMKNFGSDNFFQANIHIINPYQSTSETYLEQPLDSSQPIVSKIRKSNSTMAVEDTESAYVSVGLDKSVAGQREKITLDIVGKDESVNAGSYAISVRRVDSVPSPTQISSEAFFKNFLKEERGRVALNKDETNIPEIRGEVISGTIVNKETKLPVQGQRISLSLPGEDFLLKVATSDDKGRFWFIVDREYDNNRAALEVLSDDWESYELKMDAEKIDVEQTEFEDFVLSKRMKEYILEKSIQNQIENAYQEIKSDSILVADHVEPFYRKFATVYDLDDYTRFNRLDETIVEVVDQVSIRKLNNGERVFEVRPEEGFTSHSLLPMVFVDGLFIKRHEDFMDFSAKKIKTISFSRDKIIVGAKTFQGVISFKTIEGGFYQDFYTPHTTSLELFKPEAQKEYFTQSYSGDKSRERVPDFRNQLLWEPNLDLSKGSKEIVFYTSDLGGTYELVLEGFTSTGKPVSVNRTFFVR